MTELKMKTAVPDILYDCVWTISLDTSTRASLNHSDVYDEWSRIFSTIVAPYLDCTMMNFSFKTAYGRAMEVHVNDTYSYHLRDQIKHEFQKQKSASTGRFTFMGYEIPLLSRRAHVQVEPAPLEYIEPTLDEMVLSHRSDEYDTYKLFSNFIRQNVDRGNGRMLIWCGRPVDDDREKIQKTANAIQRSANHSRHFPMMQIIDDLSTSTASSLVNTSASAASADASVNTPNSTAAPVNASPIKTMFDIETMNPNSNTSNTSFSVERDSDDEDIPELPRPGPWIEEVD